MQMSCNICSKLHPGGHLHICQYFFAFLSQTQIRAAAAAAAATASASDVRACVLCRRLALMR